MIEILFPILLLCAFYFFLPVLSRLYALFEKEFAGIWKQIIGK